MKFIKYAVLTVTVLFIGIATYDYFKLGYHTLPNNTPENSFPLRFENGIRAILVGIDDVEPEREYIAVAMKNIPSYFSDSWAFCKRPDDGAIKKINSSFPPGPGMKFEAVCELDADGQIIPTAYIYSIPAI